MAIKYRRNSSERLQWFFFFTAGLDTGVVQRVIRCEFRVLTTIIFFNSNNEQKSKAKTVIS